MRRTKPPAICFVGTSNSGKTTLITKLIAIFQRRGLRVGAIKHHQHDFTIDKENKDSWRLTQAGAEMTVITAPTQTALIRKTNHQLEPEMIISTYFTELDLVLVEGFKESNLPKIEVCRSREPTALICRGGRNDPNLLAVAAKRNWQLDVPVFSLDDLKNLAIFVLDFCQLL